MTTIQEAERDGLATVIFDTYLNNMGAGPLAPKLTNTGLAESILEAGYRKPRIVATIEDLDALPFETVIRDAEGHVLERWGDAEHVMWSTPGCKWFVPATEIALPVTVLYEVLP